MSWIHSGLYHSTLCAVIIGLIGLTSAITRYECDFGSTAGICDYTQDTNDDFNWTGQRSSSNTRHQDIAPSDTFVCACKEGARPSPGSIARFRSGIFPATGDSMVTISFWYNIYRRDGGELKVFLMNHGSTNEKKMLMKKRSDGRGWKRVDFNESVSEPFQLIFEATVGETPNSGVALSNLTFTVYSPRKFTGKVEHGGIVVETSKLPVEEAGNISKGNTLHTVDNKRPSLTFLIAVVASSAVVVILILFVVVVLCLVRKIRILSSTAHPYEEISSNKSERGTMEITHQKDMFINENGSTLPRWKHLSYLSAHDSNRSSIYAEITEAEERRSRFHRSGTGTTGDSFVTAYSLQHLIDRATAHVITKSTETSRRQSESGWVDNVIYESGSDMRELTASEDKNDKEVPTYRRFTGPGAFRFGEINAGWIEDLSRSRTL